MAIVQRHIGKSLRRLAHFTLATLIGAGGHALAADSVPLKLVVPYPAGGPADIVARAIAPPFAEELGRPVIIDNRAGASGMIGAQLVAKAAPDGNTLLINPPIQVILPSLQLKMPYDVIRDFTHLGATAAVPLVLAVNNSVPAKSVDELARYLKAHPNQFGFATPGQGSSSHLAGEQFKQSAGLEVQAVTYKGSAPAITDLIGGQVQFMFDSLPSIYPFVKGGKLRGLAVTSAVRTRSAPQLPTMIELGFPGFVHANWYGVWGPAGMPPEASEKIIAALQKTMQRKDVRDRLLEMGADPVENLYGPQFETFVKSEMARYAKLVMDAGIKPE